MLCSATVQVSELGEIKAEPGSEQGLASWCVGTREPST